MEHKEVDVEEVRNEERRECERMRKVIEDKEYQIEQMEGLVSQMEAEMTQMKERFRRRED